MTFVAPLDGTVYGLNDALLFWDMAMCLLGPLGVLITTRNIGIFQTNWQNHKNSISDGEDRIDTKF